MTGLDPAGPPLWEAELIGGPEQREIVLVDSSPSWPGRFEEEASRIRAALAGAAVRVEHVGSTSVRGLRAKPIIDIQVSVVDVEDEPAYAPLLMEAGYVLRVRERAHRMLRTPALDVHVHVCDAGGEWERRHLLFRDWLRYNRGDRALYEGMKEALADRSWPTMNHYADAKTPVIAAIMERAEAWAVAMRWRSEGDDIGEPTVVDVERDTARYYDAETDRDSRPLDRRRVAARERFIELVRAGRSGPVLEIGTGPGRDARSMVEAGLPVVGVDLSAGHAGRAASGGLTVAVATARALPFATGSIGALWSMSTLMHIPTGAIEGAMREVGRVLAPGAAVAIGVWGGPDVEHFSGPREDGSGRRLFSRRSGERWRPLLELVGRIDEFQTWLDEAADPDDPNAFRYQLAFLTAHARTSAPSLR